MAESYWAADVRISTPVPAGEKQVDLGGGFMFTHGGIAHDITEATAKRISTPNFAPETIQETVYEDNYDTEPVNVDWKVL